MHEKNVDAVIASALWRVRLACRSPQDDQGYFWRLQFAADAARRSYDQTRGVPLARWQAICVRNEGHRIIRSALRERGDARYGAAVRLDQPIGDNDGRSAAIIDLVADTSGCYTARSMYCRIELRDLLESLRGRALEVAVALLAGYRRSEIARRLGLPRATFDLRFGRVIDSVREVLNG